MEQNIDHVDDFDHLLTLSYNLDIELDEVRRQKTGGYDLSYFVKKIQNQYRIIGTLH